MQKHHENPMTSTLNAFRAAVTPIVVLLACPVALAHADGPRWQPEAAGRYLDSRATAWFAFDGRGEGLTRSTCVSCHTVLPYILARPALRKLTGALAPTEPEAKLLVQTKMRVKHW
ncbi:MAG: hypothetical protein ACREHD_16750, partial [Pirellulales bacterium]